MYRAQAARLPAFELVECGLAGWVRREVHAWVHHRQHVHNVPVVPLPGTTRVSHLRANVAACDIRLSDDELRRLDSLRLAGA